MTGYVGLYMTVQWAMYDCVELRRAKYWTINNVVKPLYDGYTTYLTAAVPNVPEKDDLRVRRKSYLVPRIFSFSNIENEKREDPGDKVAIAVNYYSAV